MEVDHSPLTLPEYIFAAFRCGIVFSVLDLSKAYLQLEVDEREQVLLTVNTHLGLFRFERLPYGVACPPALFQAVIEQVLHCLQGTAFYLDDVAIARETRKQCHDRLERVLIRLSQQGIRVKAEICKLSQKILKYMGQEIDKGRLHPNAEKVAVAKIATKPGDVTRLKAFLGLVNFDAKLYTSLATVLEPLHSLLRWETK